MGVDITLHLIKGKDFIKKDFFPGRNTEWFSQLSGRSDNKIEYRYLPRNYGIPEDVPDEIQEDYNEGDYYDFQYIKVADYIKWARQYKPWEDAGWVSRYNKYLWEKKGIVPEEVYHHNPTTRESNEYEWIEFYDNYENAGWLYDVVTQEDIPEDAYICYYFDC